MSAHKTEPEGGAGKYCAESAISEEVKQKTRNGSDIRGLQLRLVKEPDVSPEGRPEHKLRLDDVDGALFSRMSVRSECLGPPVVIDELDGAQFSRTSSKNFARTSCPVALEISGVEVNSAIKSDECSIRPDDLDSVDSDVAPNESSSDIRSKKRRKKKTKKRKMESEVDFEDAIQGSRSKSLNFTHGSSVLDFEPSAQIEQVNDFIGVNSNVTSQNPTFYLPHNEAEIPEDKTFSQGIDRDTIRNDPDDAQYNKTNANSVTKSDPPSQEWKTEYDENGSVMRADAPDKLVDHEPAHGDTENTSSANKDSGESFKLNNRAKSLSWRIVRGLAFPLFGLLLYLWDIGSDIRLAIDYKSAGDVTRFGITVACILIPHVLMAVVDVSWVLIDMKKEKKEVAGQRNRRMENSWYRVVLGVLTLGRIVRSITYMYHIYQTKILPKHEDGVSTSPENVPMIKQSTSNDVIVETPSVKRKRHKDRAREEKRDCFMLDFMNAFAESAPQLSVQLYLYYRYDLELTLVRVLNLLSSWMSIAWTYAAYYRCNREALIGTEDVTFFGFIFFFAAFLGALAARFVSVVLFLVFFRVWQGAVVMGIHFAVMFGWITFKEKPKLEGTTNIYGRYLYYIFFAYVCILGFMNLNNTKARVRMTVFYALMYAENIILVSLTAWKMNVENRTEYSVHYLIVAVGCIVHVILLANYYMLLHPKTGDCYNCSRNTDQNASCPPGQLTGLQSTQQTSGCQSRISANELAVFDKAWDTKTHS